MKTITVFSLKGGTGRTSVVCNLAAALYRQGRRCMAIDTDPQNALGLHLGMQVGERFGIARETLTEKELDEFRKTAGSPMPYVPFGHCDLQEYLDMEGAYLFDQVWWTQRKAALVNSDTEFLLLDTPSGLLGHAYQRFEESDLVLIVLRPDAASYATIPDTEALLARYPQVKWVRYLINEMDASKTLCNDVRQAMSNTLGERLLKVTVPLDEAMRDSFGQQRSTVEHHPESQSARAFHELAKWVMSTLPTH